MWASWWYGANPLKKSIKIYFVDLIWIWKFYIMLLVSMIWNNSPSNSKSIIKNSYTFILLSYAEMWSLLNLFFRPQTFIDFATAVSWDFFFNLRNDLACFFPLLWKWLYLLLRSSFVSSFATELIQLAHPESIWDDYLHTYSKKVHSSNYYCLSH